MRSAESLARRQRLRDGLKDRARATELRHREAGPASSAAAQEPAHEEIAVDEVELSEGAATDDVERLLREVESAGAGVEPGEVRRRSELSYGGGAGDFGDVLGAAEAAVSTAMSVAPAGYDVPLVDDGSAAFAADAAYPATAHLDQGFTLAYNSPHDPLLDRVAPFNNLGAPLSSSPSLSPDPSSRPPSTLDGPRRFSSTHLDPQAALLHDDGAYRAAMRAQWPRTTL